MWVIDIFDRDDLTTESNPRTELRFLDGIERARRNLSCALPPPGRGQDAPTRRV